MFVKCNKKLMQSVFTVMQYLYSVCKTMYFSASVQACGAEAAIVEKYISKSKTGNSTFCLFLVHVVRNLYAFSIDD